MSHVIPDYQIALTYFDNRPLSGQHAIKELTKGVQLVLRGGIDEVQLQYKQSTIFSWFPEGFLHHHPVKNTNDEFQIRNVLSTYTPILVDRREGLLITETDLSGEKRIRPYNLDFFYALNGEVYSDAKKASVHNWKTREVNDLGNASLRVPYKESALVQGNRMCEVAELHVRDLLNGTIDGWSTFSGPPSTHEMLLAETAEHLRHVVEHPIQGMRTSVLLYSEVGLLKWLSTDAMLMFYSFSPTYYKGIWEPSKLSEVELYSFNLQYGDAFPRVSADPKERAKQKQTIHTTLALASTQGLLNLIGFPIEGLL